MSLRLSNAPALDRSVAAKSGPKGHRIPVQPGKMDSNEKGRQCRPLLVETVRVYFTRSR